MPHIIQRVIGLILLLSSLPAIFLLSIFVAFDIRGLSIFRRQVRVGKNSELFIIHKLRTSRHGESGFSRWPTEDSPEWTRLGKFLRRFHLDELPQFYDVARGKMNLVGPRPEAPIFSKYFDEHIENYPLRRSVYPGITGLAQVKGYKGNTSINERLRLDLEYISKRNFIFDVKILFMTIIEVFSNREYRSKKTNSKKFVTMLNQMARKSHQP